MMETETLLSHLLDRPLLTSVLVLPALAYAYQKATSKGSVRPAFTNSENRKVKTLSGDTRYRRFSHGSELSDQGREMAGDEPFLVWNGNIQELIISQPDQLQEFCRKDAKDHTKPKNMNLGDSFGQLLGGAAGVQAGKKWTKMRSHFDPEFSRNASFNMIPMFFDEAKTWLTELSPISDGDASNFVRNITDVCRLLPFRLIGITTYGEAFTKEIYDKLVELNDVHDRLMLDAFFGKWTVSRLYNMLPTESRRRMMQFQSEWMQFNDGIITSARKNSLRCPAETIYKGVEAGDMSKTEFLQTVDELLFTNIDVTSTAIASLLMNIAENQPFQTKLREEMQQMKAQADYSVDAYIAKREVLLHYAMLESLRMRPVLWFTLPEKTAMDKEIGGYHVPAGTPVVIDWKRLNTSASVWGEDSTAFRPERFEGMSPLKYRHAFLRFGFSRERCLGKNISEIVLKTILIAVLERYELRPKTHNAVRNDRFTVTLDDEIVFCPLK